jgi:hypothetical protein
MVACSEFLMVVRWVAETADLKAPQMAVWTAV